MGDALQFAKELAESTEDPALDRWAIDLQEFIATQSVYLARRLEQLPEGLRDKYWDVVTTALQGVSDNFRIAVSADLRAMLTQSAPERALGPIQLKVCTLPGAAA